MRVSAPASPSTSKSTVFRVYPALPRTLSGIRDLGHQAIECRMLRSSAETMSASSAHLSSSLLRLIPSARRQAVLGDIAAQCRDELMRARRTGKGSLERPRENIRAYAARAASSGDIVLSLSLFAVAVEGSLLSARALGLLGANASAFPAAAGSYHGS